MGRRFNRNKFAQRKRDRKNGVTAERTERRAEPYLEIVRDNDAFIKYYKHLNICANDEEFEKFLHAIRADLPTTFRITGCRSEAKKLLNIIQTEFFNTYVVNSDIQQPQGDATTPILTKPVCLPWYPNELAWQLELTRKDIRRSESLYKLHNFLIAETTAGSISRQEAVSMIPPLVLDVQPHHKVLDMCAAPGSKTAQLIEALHADENQPIPSGIVVANDVDNNRCYMLVHQAKRLNSPCFVVTNHDSSVMPQFVDQQNVDLKFDRILCDVPCSGDGTLRKNPDIWLKWNQGHALNLHGVQYRIARRGAELLAVGGRLVYSTCSLNPVENEAVLHRLVKESDGALEIIDGSHLVPGLKFSPGLSYWELCNKEINFYKTFDEVPDTYHTIIRPQMFPPDAANASKFNLDKCMRILPQFQNTGGFFVAVLVKKKLMPWESKKAQEVQEAQAKAKEPQNTENADGAATEAQQQDQSATEPNAKSAPWGPQRKKRRLHGYKEDPFVFFGNDEPVWLGIKKFYEIEKLSNNFDPTCLLTRCVGGKKKNIYFCSKNVKELVQANENAIKIINTGVKVWVRCDNRNMRCEFRLANEGLNTIEYLVGNNRRIAINKDDLIILLQNVDPLHPPQLDILSENVQSRVADVTAGSCLLIYKDDTDFTLILVGWRGTKTLRAYTDTNDSVHMLRLLGADLSKYDINKFKKNENPINGSQDDEAADIEKIEVDADIAAVDLTPVATIT